MKDHKSIWAATCQNQQSECVLGEDSDQPGHPPSLIRVFAVRMKKAWILSYPLSAQRRLWSDWADAQADLSLSWVHTPFVGFVMLWLICHLLYKHCIEQSQDLIFPQQRETELCKTFAFIFLFFCGFWRNCFFLSDKLEGITKTLFQTRFSHFYLTIITKYEIESSMYVWKILQVETNLPLKVPVLIYCWSIKILTKSLLCRQ